MCKPEYHPRRPLQEKDSFLYKKSEYLESDKDFVLNNLELAVHLLENQPTEFEQKTLMKVVEAASMDASIPLTDLGFSRHEVGACTRIKKKLA